MSSRLRKSFIRNIGYGALTRLTQALVGFFLITYVIKTVGIEDWGILTVSVSLISLLSVIQVSLSGSTGKRLTDFLVKKDPEEYNRYFSGTLIVCFVIVLIIILAIGAYYLFFLKDFSDNRDYFKLKTIFLLTGLNSIIQVSSLPGVAVLQSINRIDINAKITTGGFILRTILVLVIFTTNNSIVIYSLLLSIEMASNFILTYFWILYKSKLKLKFQTGGITFNYLLDILRFNLLNFVNSLNYLFFIQLPAIIIAKKYGMVYSGYYGIGIQLNTLIRGLSNILMNPLTPVFNILKAEGNFNKLKNLLKISNLCFLIMGLIIISISLFLMEPLIEMWLGQTSIELVQFLRIFLFFTAIGVIFIPTAILIVTIEKLEATTFIGFILSLIASLLVFILPASKNEFIWVPSIISFLFLIYNLHRYYVASKFISFSIKDIKTLFYIVFLIILSFILIPILGFPSLVEFFLANVVMILIVLLMTEKKTFSNLFTLIKNNQ